MEYNAKESGLFAQACDTMLDKLADGVDKALASAAARGFARPDGATLAAILAECQETKAKLTEVNGKIYEDQRGVIFQQAEFALQLMVKIAKLALELYRADLMNALALEQADMEALRETDRADIARLNSETDQRQVAIMRNQAEAEQEVIALKQQLVVAQTATLAPERALIEAQLATAEKKLEIIQSIYQVLAAEQLVLAAEQRRATALQEVLAAEQILVAIKQEMIPLYENKAEARIELAQAITDEMPVRKALENLGFARIDLKDQTEADAHLMRVAENASEVAHATFQEARKFTMLAREQAKRILQQYSNTTKEEILAQKQVLTEAGIDLRLDTAYAHHKIEFDSAVTLTQREIYNMNTELATILQNIVTKAIAHAAAISASGNTTEYLSSFGTHYQWETII